MCIRGEPLLCLDYSFLPQKTADNLNYAQRKRDAQKTNNMYLHLLQAHVDPTSTLCNWLFNGQFEKENSHSLKRPNKCVQSETVVPLSPESENKKKLGQSMSKLLQGISYPVILLNWQFRSNTLQKTMEPNLLNQTLKFHGPLFKARKENPSTYERSISDRAKRRIHRKSLYSTRPHDLSVKETLVKSTLRILQNRLYQLRKKWRWKWLISRCKCLVGTTNPLFYSLTLWSLRVISIKFLLVISMLCKAEWSWELRIWSHKMNLLDILSTSPRYFCWKWIRATSENSNFDLRI